MINARQTAENNCYNEPLLPAILSYYLYVAGDDSQPIFHGIEEETAQLNDFCLLCIEGTFALRLG